MGGDGIKRRERGDKRLGGERVRGMRKRRRLARK